jgi:hypothetical protein
MEKKYKLSTNWLPWLGFGFLLSTIFFGFVSNGWVLFLLILLSFMPSIVVALALRGYVLLDNNQLKICYDRQDGREMTSTLNIADISSIERVGKSIVFHLDNDEDVTMRVSWANLLVEEIVEQNPRIEYEKK